MQQRMPIGIEDFQRLITGNYYFVDKTDFIRQLIDNHGAVTLITRPRRFGKTLTMSMLAWFFSLEKERQSRTLFQGLAIEKAGAAYMQQRGQYPVLFFTLKNFSARTWQDMFGMWQNFLQDLFLQHTYLRKGKQVQPELLADFESIIQRRVYTPTLSTAIALLMKMMHQYYGKRVILLIDEYDAPIQQAWNEGFYKDSITFMRQLLGSALKTNDDLEFALVTGVMRVAKESIFSGLNNFQTCSVLDKKYSDIFGFTAQEIRKMLVSLHQPEKMPEIRSWYDGYRMGGQEIYNPWSVLNYLENDCLPKAYWVRTSGNSILRLSLTQADPLQIAMVQDLVQGKSIKVTLDESVVYPEIGQDPSVLFTMLLTTGYLTVEKEDPLLPDRYLLRIPNKEIRQLYSTEILNYLAQGINRNTFDNLFEFLFQGETEKFSWQLQKILNQFVSTYDTANKESFYHGFMLGMTALFLGSDYQVESNRESGYGRFDLAIFPKDVHKTGVIMEFKAAAQERDLKNKAEEALQQITERAYSTEFTKRGIQHVWKYGIAFCGKKVCVVSENK